MYKLILDLKLATKAGKVDVVTKNPFQAAAQQVVSQIAHLPKKNNTPLKTAKSPLKRTKTIQDTLNDAKKILKGGKRGASRSKSVTKPKSVTKKPTKGTKTSKNSNKAPKVAASKKIKKNNGIKRTKSITQTIKDAKKFLSK